MNTNQIGNLGELKVIERCLQNNISVFLPFGDGNVVDMVIVINGKCLKAQVKSSQTNNNGCVTFKMKSEKSNRQEGIHHYTAKEIDIYLCYSYAYDEVYLIPFTEAPTSVLTIRHIPPKNNIKSVHMAENYLLEKQMVLWSNGYDA